MSSFFQLIKFVVLCRVFYTVSSECENGCSGHGRCTVFDMCICNRNWMGNDCSERVCEFGISFVDTPKGDLDSSDYLEGTDDTVVINSPLYPYGTTEKFPSMVDSNLQPLHNSAHYYGECSNAGICDRQTGICDCFEGFTGAGCQRMQCPGYPLECSGHGVCQNVKQIAHKDSESTYKLWNKELSRGCICDKGYTGGDCSIRRCKSSLDPLYLDDVSTIQYPFYFFAVLTTGDISDISNGHGGVGYFRIMIHDDQGQRWYSNPIPSGADCETVLRAIDGIPQAVIPPGETKCYKVQVLKKNPLGDDDPFTISYPSLYRFYFSGRKIYTSSSRPLSIDTGFKTSYAVNTSSDPLLSGDIYLIQFFGNPGDFPQPEVNIYVNDGTRPTVVSYPKGTLLTRSWTNGQQGASIDYFPDHCHGVSVSVISYSGKTYLWGQFVPSRLMRCLGSADHDPDNNLVTTGGDHGSEEYPHLIKLVRTTANYKDGNYYVAVYWDTSESEFDGQTGIGGTGINIQGGAFRVMHPFAAPDDSSTVLFDVYTTTGILERTGQHSEAVFEFATNKVYTTNVTRDFNGLSEDGVLSCEAAGIPVSASALEKHDCLEKNDLFMLIDPYTTLSNPPYMNLYRALSIRAISDDYLPTIGQVFPNATLTRRNITSHYHKYVITTDINTNWAQDAPGNTGLFHVYKFTPHVNSTYHVIAECSNRGICDPFEGLCDCFPGYAGDSCSQQDSMSF